MGGITHGHTRRRGGKQSNSPTYMTWIAMRNRCHNPRNEKYSDYGACGITVCDSWRNSFEQFLADMGERPDGMTLDRVDGSKGYSPENCRWATPSEQAQNSDRVAKGWKRNNTHCPSGHPYSGKNLAIKKDGSRKCKECDRLRAAARRKRAKESR